MSTRRFELRLPMGGLFGVSIYKAGIETPEGYRDEPIDPYSLDWQWYVHIRTYECVRMARLRGDTRVLASPLGKGAAAYDIPDGMVLVHDLWGIWAMEQFDFQTEYSSAKLLVKAMPQGNVGIVVATP